MSFDHSRLAEEFFPAELRHSSGLLQRLFTGWILDTLSVMVVIRFVRGFQVLDVFRACLASVVIGFVNLVLGLFAEAVAQPLSAFFFMLSVDIFLLRYAVCYVEGFYPDGLGTALIGAMLLAFLNSVFVLSLFG